MESVRHNIFEHGRIASVQRLSECAVGMIHSDGWRYAIVIADLCEHGEIVAVRLIGQAGEGIALTFDDTHERTIFFADVRPPQREAPSIIPALSEERVREFAL